MIDRIILGGIVLLCGVGAILCPFGASDARSFFLGVNFAVFVIGGAALFKNVKDLW